MLSLEKKSQLDLSKTVELTLQKKSLQAVQANVVLALDVSGSMAGLYSTGQVQLAAERALALASKWDTDQQVDVYIFDGGARHIGQMGTSGFDGWVNENIYQKGYVGGGTNYGPVIDLITKNFSNPKSGGLFGFGGKPSPAQVPTYVIFMTDGENSDRAEATKAITTASNNAIFWQFVGLGNAGFRMLQELDDLQGRYIDNADFFRLNASVTDEQLYDSLLNEFPGWLTQAKNKGLLV